MLDWGIGCLRDWQTEVTVEKSEASLSFNLVHRGSSEIPAKIRVHFLLLDVLELTVDSRTTSRKGARILLTTLSHIGEITRMCLMEVVYSTRCHVFGNHMGL